MRCKGRGRVRAVYAYALLMRGCNQQRRFAFYCPSYLSVSLFAEPLKCLWRAAAFLQKKERGLLLPGLLVLAMRGVRHPLACTVQLIWLVCVSVCTLVCGAEHCLAVLAVLILNLQEA